MEYFKGRLALVVRPKAVHKNEAYLVRTLHNWFWHTVNFIFWLNNFPEGEYKIFLVKNTFNAAGQCGKSNRNSRLNDTMIR